MQWVIRLSAVTLPLLLLAAGAAALYKKQDVFTVLTDGAREGLKTVGRLIPVLCGLLCAVYMLRASGAFELLAAAVRPLLDLLGVPAELTPLVLLRPFSGSGALAAASDVMKSSGVDSLAGRMAAVMLASSETTLYTASVYFGAAGVKKTRYALIAAFGEMLLDASQTDADTVYETLLTHVSQMEEAALACARENGFIGPVTAEAGVLTLPAKTYGQVTLPEGDYRALRVTLGSGQGQNWWCVLFPQLCLAVSSDGVEAKPAAVPDLTWDAERIFSQWLIFPL